MGLRLLIVLMILCLESVSAFGKPLLILHTNDTHSFLENSVFDLTQGGYARLKTLIDSERARAASLGIPTLTLDAGDFLEGTMFYMADRGEAVMHIMDTMGYDAITVGNHDWLMGTSDMSHLLSDVNYSFTLLADNLRADTSRFPGLKKLQPYKIMEIDGKKIAILGYTTDENNFKWAFDQGHITEPLKSMQKWGKKLKAMGVKTVIGLSHLGFNTDIELIGKTKDIDLVVGGHSHSLIDRPYLALNKNGRPIPVVQAGENAKYLGTLLVDIADDGSVTVLERHLLPVDTNVDENPAMLELVQDARAKVNKLYGEDYLSTVIGSSEVDLISSSGSMTVWNKVLADAIKESINADIGVHSPNLTGSDLKKGALTREQIMMSYPHYLSLDDRWGWRIYNVKIYGAVAKMLMEYYLKGGDAVVLSGVKFRIEVDKKGKKKIKDITVNGQPLQVFKKYTVAFPEAVIKGGLGITGLLMDILHSIERTEICMWDAFEAKIRHLGVIPADYLSRPDREAAGKNKSLEEDNYMFLPATR